MKFQNKSNIRSRLFPLLQGLALVFCTVALAACGSSGNDGVTDPVTAATGPANPPANPAADQAATRLLSYLHEISGKQILSGQEQLFWDNEFAPHFPSIREQYVFDQVARYPALYSTDFGDFHHATDPVRREEILAMRGGVVDAVIAHAERGSVIQLHYHMVEPTEPDGSGLRNYRDGVYNPEYIDQILGDGSTLNLEYEKRLDEIAAYLTLLRDQGIAVLWRPFHEMNGPWFWWSRQERFQELWQHQWRYFTEVHGLTNLVWVFSVNYWERDSGPEWDPATYYPGHQYVDVLGVDIYRSFEHNYDQHVYDALLKLGEQRPIGITENGQMPELASLRVTQPRWAFWATWFGYEASSSDTLYQDNFIALDDYVITQDETWQPVPDSLQIQEPAQDPTVPAVGNEPDSDAVVMLEGTPGDGLARLSWNSVPGVSWFNVWFGNSRDSLDWLEGTSDNTFTASQLTNGSSYFFAVTTYVDEIDGPFSNIVEVIPAATNPLDTESDLVLNLRATAGDSEVLLEWNSLPGVSWYNVWLGTDQDSLEWLEGTGSSNYTVRQLSSGVPYYFAVTPYSNETDGQFSNIVEIVLQ